MGKLTMTVTGYFIRHYYENYLKTSSYTIDCIYSKRSLLALTSDSRRLQNSLHVLPTISLLKMVDAVVILAFSSRLALHKVLLVSCSTTPHT